MTANAVPAVYENGVLKPAHPLPFAEGTNVEVTVVASAPRVAADDERRASAVAALQTLIDAAPEDSDEDYDLLSALDEHRSYGERRLFPPEQKGISW
jgi:predicted DNA-binding antitoxin AbrB/MazE fold protein